METLEKQADNDKTEKSSKSLDVLQNAQKKDERLGLQRLGEDIETRKKQLSDLGQRSEANLSNKGKLKETTDILLMNEYLEFFKETLAMIKRENGENSTGHLEKEIGKLEKELKSLLKEEKEIRAKIVNPEAEGNDRFHIDISEREDLMKNIGISDEDIFPMEELKNSIIAEYLKDTCRSEENASYESIRDKINNEISQISDKEFEENLREFYLKKIAINNPKELANIGEHNKKQINYLQSTLNIVDYAIKDIELIIKIPHGNLDNQSIMKFLGGNRGKLVKELGKNQLEEYEKEEIINRIYSLKENLMKDLNRLYKSFKQDKNDPYQDFSKKKIDRLYSGYISGFTKQEDIDEINTIAANAPGFHVARYFHEFINKTLNIKEKSKIQGFHDKVKKSYEKSKEDIITFEKEPARYLQEECEKLREILLQPTIQIIQRIDIRNAFIGEHMNKKETNLAISVASVHEKFIAFGEKVNDQLLNLSDQVNARLQAVDAEQKKLQGPNSWKRQWNAWENFGNKKLISTESVVGADNNQYEDIPFLKKAKLYDPELAKRIGDLDNQILNLQTKLKYGKLREGDQEMLNQHFDTCEQCVLDLNKETNPHPKLVAEILDDMEFNQQAIIKLYKQNIVNMVNRQQALIDTENEYILMQETTSLYQDEDISQINDVRYYKKENVERSKDTLPENFRLFFDKINQYDSEQTKRTYELYLTSINLKKALGSWKFHGKYEKEHSQLIQDLDECIDNINSMENPSQQLVYDSMDKAECTLKNMVAFYESTITFKKSINKFKTKRMNIDKFRKKLAKYDKNFISREI